MSREPAALAPAAAAVAPAPVQEAPALRPDSVGAGSADAEPAPPPEASADLQALRKAARRDDSLPLPFSPAADKAEAPPVDASMQRNVKIVCPNCKCAGELPWGKMDSLLCCSRCWGWYRVGANGSLTKAPPPKGFAKGTLRFHQGNGQARVVAITPGEVRRQRRAWIIARLLGAVQGRSLNKELLMAGVLLAYLLGLFALVYFQTPGADAATVVPAGQPPIVIVDDTDSEVPLDK